jgi:membrane fusion protein, copper/silver efflux system
MTTSKLIRVSGFLGLALLIMQSPLTMFKADTGLHRAFAQHEGHGSGAPAKPESMKEQPKEQKAAEEAATVEVPLEKQQMIGVKTTAASVQAIQRTIRTVGRVEYDEKKLATINLKFEGWLEKLYADSVGKYVKKGDPLAEVYSPELFATQQEFINLLKWKNQSSEIKDESIKKMLSQDSEAIVEAAKQRLKLWDISDDQIQSIAESGKPVRTLTIYSPINGYVILKAAVQGMRVMPGDKLFDIADLSAVWIISDIYEYELPMIHAGDMARISLSYFPGKTLLARVDYIYPVLASETRTTKVRFSVPNPEGKLKPGMFTNVDLKINMGKKLVVPQDAVIDTGTRQIVYVDKGGGYFEPRDVVTGIRSDGMVEVLKGLRAQERVASAATFLIDSEARLKGVVK